MNVNQFRAEIVAPTLRALDMHSEAAVRLMVGTALVESGLDYLRQIGGGPALGVFQIEPATARDVLFRYLAMREELRRRVMDWLCYDPLSLTHTLPSGGETQLERRLKGDLHLGCVVARLKYWMDPRPLPDASDIPNLGGVWKDVYNTKAGAGTVGKFVSAYHRAHAQSVPMQSVSA